MEARYGHITAVLTLAATYQVLSEHMLIPVRAARHGMLPFSGGHDFMLVPSRTPSNIAYTQFHQLSKVMDQYKVLTSDANYADELLFVGNHNMFKLDLTKSNKNWALCQLIRRSYLLLKSFDRRISAQQFHVELAILQEFSQIFYNDEIQASPSMSSQCVSTHIFISEIIIFNKLQKLLLHCDQILVKFNREMLYDDMIVMLSDEKNEDLIQTVQNLEQDYHSLMPGELVRQACKVQKFVARKYSSKNHSDWVNAASDELIEASRKYDKTIENWQKGLIDESVMFHFITNYKRYAIYLLKSFQYNWNIWLPWRNVARFRYV